MTGDTFAPSHVDSGVFKKALNWFTGKSVPEMTSGKSPSVSNPPSYMPDVNLTATGQEKKSVAILPFKNLGQDDSASFYEFARRRRYHGACADQIIIVRPSSVIAKYHGKNIDPREAGRELRVHAVLSAGFLRGGDKLRVTARFWTC